MHSTRIGPSASSLLLAGSLALCAAPAGARPPERAPDFGTTDRILVHIALEEFAPQNSSMGWKFFESAGFEARTGVTPGTFTAPIHVPSGVRLASLELDFCDSSVTDHISANLLDCDTLGGGCTLLDSINTRESGCESSLTTSPP